MESLLSEDQTPADRLAFARVLLQPTKARDPAWPALAAAAFFAFSAMTFAVSAILAPTSMHAPLPDRQ